MALARNGRLVKVAFRNLLRSRLSSSLAIFAAMTGTGGVIVCTGYAAAGRQKIFDQFQRMGTNLIVVTPQQSRAVGGRARTGALVTTLRNPDYRAILQAVPDISASSPTVAAAFRVRAGDLTKSTTIVGCEAAYFTLRSWSAHTGSLFTNYDDRSARRLALLGATAARDLFGQSDPSGLRISINRVPFTVAGVLEERGQGLDAANQDAEVYVPLGTAMRRLMNVDYYASMLFQIRSWRGMDDASRRISDFLGRRHRLLSFRGPDFQVQNQKSLIDTQLEAFNRLTFFLRWIAAATLAVASLGIFGVAWIGVGYRTREIGTCRAMGATRIDVLTQFFVEAIAGPLLGCVAGVAASWLLLRAIDLRVQQPFLFSVQTAAEAAIASSVLYAISAVACCMRAIRIEPSVAIRNE